MCKLEVSSQDDLTSINLAGDTILANAHDIVTYLVDASINMIALIHPYYLLMITSTALTLKLGTTKLYTKKYKALMNDIDSCSFFQNSDGFIRLTKHCPSAFLFHPRKTGFGTNFLFRVNYSLTFCM